MSLPARPELTGGRAIGVLLLHGFSGSPAAMRPWAEHLAGQGYAVEVPLLPGHGTRWQDLNRVRWTDWYAEAERALDRLRTGTEAVVVGALSMGGSVALRLAEERGADVAGVVLVNPFVSSRRKELVALPVVKHLVPAAKGVVNDIKKPGQDEVGYPRLPLKGLAEIVGMWRVVVPDLPRVTQPLLYFRSSVDHVIDDSSSRTVLGAVSSRDAQERVLAESYHVATLDNDAPQIFEESAAFVARVTARPE
jgi:carboxylesterase